MKITISTRYLQEAIYQIANFASTDTHRPTLLAAMIEKEDDTHVRISAANGFIAATTIVPAEIDGEPKLLIPMESIKAFANPSSDLLGSISFDDRYSAGESSSFPNIRAIFPSDDDIITRFVLNDAAKNCFTELHRTLRKINKRNLPIIRLNISEEGLVLVAHIEEDVLLRFDIRQEQTIGKPMVIGLNSYYIDIVIRALNGKPATAQFIAPNTPITFIPSNMLNETKYIVMPVHLGTDKDIDPITPTKKVNQ